MRARQRDAISIPPLRALAIFFAVTNGFGPRPLPAVISSIDRPEATDVSSSRMRVLLSFPGELVAMLDQKPVGALLAFSLAHPGQNPAAMKLFTLQGEIQLALCDSRARGSSQSQ